MNVDVIIRSTNTIKSTLEPYFTSLFEILEEYIPLIIPLVIVVISAYLLLHTIKSKGIFYLYCVFGFSTVTLNFFELIPSWPIALLAVVCAYIFAHTIHKVVIP